MQLGCTIALNPSYPNVSFRDLLAAWYRADFRPHKCQEALEDAIRADENLASFFDPTAIAHGGTVATQRLLYGYWAEQIPWSCRIFGSGRTLSVEVRPEEVATIAELIRTSASASNPSELTSRLGELLDGDGLASVTEVLVASTHESGRWPAIDVPGIYRREHASVIVRSATTTLLVDPTSLTPGWTSYSGRYPAESGLGRIHGVLVTHSHGDHWSLPSILAVADDGTLLVVPPVPRVSVLCTENMVESAHTAGVPAQAPAWYSTVAIGDIEVDVLPFYGEQPTRDEARLPSDLRNWGCCYRVNTPQFSALLLADAGVDPDGSMIEVLRRSYTERGPVDALLSVPSEFPASINPGLAHYAFTLPFAHLERIWRDKLVRSVTLGPDGIVDACRAAHARYYLPYADGFAGLGRRSRSGETRTAGSVAAERSLATRLAPTEYVSWLPGDVAEFVSRSIAVRPVTR